MPSSVNRVVLIGNLTKDPELRHTQGGTAVCKLRIAVNERVKDGGEWKDKPNYFDVMVFGNQADACAQHLGKGKPVAVDGRLSFREWQDSSSGQYRSAVEVKADNVQFLGGRDGGGSGGGGGGGGGFRAPEGASEGAGSYAEGGGSSGGSYAQEGGSGGAASYAGGQQQGQGLADDDIPF